VIPYFYPNIGGSERYCYELSRRLVKKGHEVSVLTTKLHKNHPSYEIIEGINIFRYPMLFDFMGSNPISYIIHGLKNIEGDIIHSHSYIFLTSLQATIMSKYYKKIPNIIHLHGGLDDGITVPDYSTNIKMLLKNRIYDNTLGKFIINNADKIASVSKKDINIAINKWKINPRVFCSLSNAIDPKEFKFNKIRLNNILFIGRLEMWKGINVLMSLIKKLYILRSDISFTIIGEGKYKNALINMSKKYDNMKVMGYVKREQLKTILSKSYLLIIPSYGIEGLPTVCLEALSSELPVVASNVGGLSELIIDGVTGYLFQPGDVSTCINKILNIVDNKKLRDEMGKNGRILIENKYNWDYIINKTDILYKDMVTS